MDINYFKAALSHHSKGNWNKAQEIYQHILKRESKQLCSTSKLWTPISAIKRIQT